MASIRENDTNIGRPRPLAATYAVVVIRMFRPYSSAPIEICILIRHKGCLRGNVLRLLNARGSKMMGT